MIKDYEWNFEHETRVLVRLNESLTRTPRIAIPLPREMIENVSITFGPWLTKRNKQKYEEKIEEAFQSQGIYSNIVLHESTLSGALNKWKEKKNGHRNRKKPISVGKTCSAIA